MNSKALLTSLFLLSSTCIAAEENPQLQKLLVLVEQLKQQVSVLQANNEKHGLQQQVLQLAEQVQHFQLESIKRNDKELAAIQADFKKQIEGLKKEVASSQQWENKAFDVLAKTLSEVQNKSVYTADNSNEQKPQTSSSATTEASGNFYNSPCRPQVKNGQDLFVMADYLIWQASEQNLDAWQEGGYTKGVGVNATNGSIKSPRFDWESGVRVGIGYNPGHDHWDLSLVWTWFEDDASRHGSGTLAKPIFGVISGPLFSPHALEASTHLDLHLNNLNLDLGKEFCVTKWLTLRPFAGIQTTWVNQHWRTKFQDIVSANVGAPISEYKTRLKQKFWGIGGQAGLGAEFGFYKGLSFFTNASFDLLYGIFKVKREESVVSTLNVENTVSKSDRSQHSTQAIADIQLGLRWDYGISQDRFQIRLQAGWENHVFFDHNYFYNFTTNTSVINNLGGDLGFQGWFVSGRFDF